MADGRTKEGETFEHWGTDFDLNDLNDKEVFTYAGKRSIELPTARAEVYQIKIAGKGVDLDGAILDVLANGFPIQGRLGVFEFRAENEEEAKKLEPTAITSDSGNR